MFQRRVIDLIISNDSDPVKWDDVVFNDSDDDELISVRKIALVLYQGRNEYFIEDKQRIS